MKLQDLKDELWFIATPGAAGGVISWVLSSQRVDARLVGPWVDLLLFAVLGSAASLTFVVLLSNTNRADTIRVVVLSFLAGLAWQPIISGGMNLVAGQEEVASLSRHIEAFGDLQEVVGGRARAASVARHTGDTPAGLVRSPDATALPTTAPFAPGGGRPPVGRHDPSDV